MSVMRGAQRGVSAGLLPEIAPGQPPGPWSWTREPWVGPRASICLQDDCRPLRGWNPVAMEAGRDPVREVNPRNRPALNLARIEKYKIGRVPLYINHQTHEPAIIF